MSDMMWADNFRENLRLAIEYRDTSLSELAKRIGASRPNLSRLVNGHNEATIPHASRIANALNIPLPVLLESQAEFRRWIQSRARAVTDQ